MSAVCGLRFTDFRQVAFSCKQRFQLNLCSLKATKQSRKLKYVFVFANLHQPRPQGHL